jgi:DNA mismatch repair protein MutS
MKEATPIRKQYLEIKQRHRDALLLFRIGDFYEAFDDDARVLAKELDIVLTSKPMGKNVRVPLAGVPHHSLERHLATLIARGHRVAICEQLTTEPVKQATGKRLIERDVVRVVTPGTVLEPGLLQTKVNNYIAAIATDGKRAGLSYADVTTGEFAATELELDAAGPELQRLATSELLIADETEATMKSWLPGFITRFDSKAFEFQQAKKTLLSHFSTRSLAPFGLSKWPLAVSAAGAVISYLRDTQTNTAEQLTRLTSYTTENFMRLDAQVFRSLEIFESATAAPSLLAVLDRTRTPMGGRLLRRWLRQPLLDVAEIVRRQEYVAWLIENRRARAEIALTLERMHDLERLSSRTRAGYASAQEVLALGQSLESVPQIKSVLQQDAVRFASLIQALPSSCEKAADVIRKAINDELPMRGTEQQGVIRAGFSDELDKLRDILRNGKTYLAELEQRERARTGIKSLRVGFNKVFGYFIEVTKPNLHLVPSDYTRKQTLIPSERFVTLELKEYESLVMRAQERIEELESSLFRQVCKEAGQSRQDILTAASTIAALDALISFAEVAKDYDYARPVVIDAPLLRIEAGRHPTLERAFEEGEFVANDTNLGGDDAPQIAIITGPNTSGKSTFLRQNALIVLLAQVGSFVPAKKATVGLCDRIFARIGLYDRIGSGESTFMTEMIETAQILHHAGPRSLILLDELGRGTSTYDGLAVARSVIEYVHNHPKIKAKTLFATHYHELTELAAVLPRLQNLHTEIAEREDDLVFLYKITEGVALKSYGVYAAQLAGLPRPVVHRAEELLTEYEEREAKSVSINVHDIKERNAAIKQTQRDKLVENLLDLDLNSISPVEALMKLYELQRLAQIEEEQKARALRTA